MFLSNVTTLISHATPNITPSPHATNSGWGHLVLSTKKRSDESHTTSTNSPYCDVRRYSITMMKINALRTALSGVSRVVTNNKLLFQSNALRSFSTQSYDKLVLTPPPKITVEMAEGISNATQFYLRYGVSKQRLDALSRDTELSAVQKWQNMMEIFLTTQVHVIAGLGYESDERGLTKYAQDLSAYLQEADDDIRDLFTEIRRDTWRELVSAAFDLQPDDLRSVSIVEARNLMHKVSSKMISPEVLQEIQTRCAELTHSDVQEHMMAEKHRVVSCVR